MSRINIQSSRGTIDLRPVMGRRGTTGPIGPAGSAGPQGPAGYNATGAAEDMETIADYMNATAGENPVSSALSSIMSAEIERAAGSIDLPTWRAAFAAAKSGASDAKILCVGDSITIGTDPVAGAPESYPYQLADALLAASPTSNAAHGFAVPSRAIQADPRWSFGAGWAEEAYGWGGASAHKGNPGCSDMLYTDSTVNADRWDVYYLQTGGGGTITAQATGGSAVNQNTDGSISIRKFTVSAPVSATTNVVTISNGSGSAIHLLGIDPYRSTQKRVRVGNVGLAGSGAVEWANYLSGFGGTEAIKAHAPHLTIISLGVNDAFHPRDVPTYTAALQAVIAAAKVSGDVLLFSPIPSKSTVDANRLTYEPIYNAVMAGLGEPYLDLYPRWGNPGSPNPDFMLDGLHPNAAGNADLAQFLLPALLIERSPFASRDEVDAAVASVTSKAGTADVQTFTSSGTWTKPAGAKTVNVFLVGPGGGGGAGARGASGVALTGGAGGGGGGITTATLPASAFSGTVAVSIPTGGAGGAAQTTDSTAGAAGGVAAGNTAFGVITALRGAGGGGGTISGSSAVGGLGGVGSLAGGSGGAASAGNAGNAAAAAPGGPGGAGGGGVSNVPAAKTGGLGGVSQVFGGTGGAAGAIDGAGGAGVGTALVAGGGGGGGSSITAAGGAGGAGGNAGGGGAGGGAALNGNASGAGGAGGPGLCVVTTYF